MPIYVYECEVCGHNFEEFQRMTDEQLMKCPKCKKKKLYRCITVPLAVFSSTPKTLGGLADKNSSQMSKEEKQRIADEYKTARDEVLFNELPANMKRVEKPKIVTPWYKKNKYL